LDVDEVHARDAVRRRLDAGDANRPLLVLGDEDAAGIQVVANVLPLVVPRLGLSDGERDLALEVLEELAQDRFVGEGGAADCHGVVSTPIRR